MESVVFLIEDEPDMQEILQVLLKSIGLQPKVYTSGEKFLEDYNGECGCVVTDVRLQGMSGLRLQQRLNEMDHLLPMVFITGHGDVPMAVKAMKAGARDFICKPFNNQELLEAIQKAVEESKISYEQLLVKNEIDQKISRLSAREKQVLELVVIGNVSKEIAKKLKISPHTVELHRSKIKQKFGVSSQRELVYLLVKNGIDYKLVNQEKVFHSNI